MARRPVRSISIETAQKIAAAWMAAHKKNATRGDKPPITMNDVMKKVGLSGKARSNFFKYRRMAEELLSITLPTLGNLHGNSCGVKRWPARTHHIHHDEPYQVIISSDHHYMPDVRYPAHDILCKVLKAIKPKYHVNNGDAFNGGKVGRFDPIGWEKGQPDTAAEYEACKLYTDELIKACPAAERYWMLGNHDIRLERYLAGQAPQWADMPGSTMDDLFPDWEFGWSMVFNDILMVKHRFHSGVHAARNNTLNSGVNIVTGHTHRLNLVKFTDYTGTRFGLEAGTIAQITSDAFHYAEDNPVNWQEGFVLITVDGKEIMPELVMVRYGDEGPYALLRGKKYSA